MIVWHQSSASRMPKFINNILAADATTFTNGQALAVNTAGRWAAAAVGGVVGGIFNGTTFTSTTNTPIEVIEAQPGDEFLADYTGAPAGTFLAGLSVANIVAGALNLDATVVTGGAFAILSVNTAQSKAVVRVKNRQFS